MIDSTTLVKQNAKDESVYRSLSEILVNKDGKHTLPDRFRALFSLKNLGTDEAVDVICKAFDDSSALLKHELAYVLGQMRNSRALPILESVLKDLNQEAMVRHEAAEALGAIGNPASIPILKKYADDDEEAVRETCLLALDLFKHSGKVGPKPTGNYISIDPAPAFEDDLSISELRSILLNEEESLYIRYQAMFSLRNIGSDEAVNALADGLRLGKSALFRHEVAFVFGQMQHPASVGVLKEVLGKNDEVDMVRHECAEALGSIATEECLPELDKYLSENVPVVVKESCQVAIDMYEHENSDSFQYALVPER